MHVLHAIQGKVKAHDFPAATPPDSRRNRRASEADANALAHRVHRTSGRNLRGRTEGSQDRRRETVDGQGRAGRDPPVPQGAVRHVRDGHRGSLRMDFELAFRVVSSLSKEGKVIG